MIWFLLVILIGSLMLNLLVISFWLENDRWTRELHRRRREGEFFDDGWK